MNSSSFRVEVDPRASRDLRLGGRFRRLQICILQSAICNRRNAPHPDHEGPAPAGLHGVPGVGDQVQHYLLELERIRPDRGEDRIEVLHHPDVPELHLLPDEGEGLPHHLVQIGGLVLPLGLAGEVPEVGDDGHHPARLGLDPAEVLPQLRVGEPLVRQQLLGIAPDDHEGLVEFMRHPGRQRPHGRQLLGLEELELGFFQGSSPLIHLL
jgi:hypothetical protein